jgi:molecular chaperone GrpE (heat shock protein)
MSQADEMEPDFAAEMHELSAQALPREESRTTSGISILISAVHGLNQRIESFEETILQRFEDLSFPKLEEQLSAIRDSETVNQKLFDSLHQELISYRDNFVRDSLQKPFIRDLLVLFDDLGAIARQLPRKENAPNEPVPNEQLRTNLENARHFLLEILHRLEVKEIDEQAKVNRAFHKVIGFEPTEDAAEDGLIVRRLKPGFIWHDKVLRPEEVCAKRLR